MMITGSASRSFKANNMMTDVSLSLMINVSDVRREWCVSDIDIE